MPLGNGLPRSTTLKGTRGQAEQLMDSNGGMVRGPLISEPSSRVGLTPPSLSLFPLTITTGIRSPKFSTTNSHLSLQFSNRTPLNLLLFRIFTNFINIWSITVWI